MKFTVPIPKLSSCKTTETPDGTNMYWTGPSLSKGKLPALFYFALSGEESLCLDPFNQPVAFLSKEEIRIFSLTLPAHGEGFDKMHALTYWNRELDENHNIISNFLQKVIASIDYLIGEKYIDPKYLAVGGLSRGGFIATHVAAIHSSVRTLLAFSPMTHLDSKSSLACSLNLPHLVDHLARPTLSTRFYIGNFDTRVGTDKCFSFIHKLSEKAMQKKIRPPPIEMIISPSIGNKGHGTSTEVFYDGACWVKNQLSTRTAKKE